MELTTDTGVTGVGFTYGGARAKAIQALLDWHLSPMLLGSEIAPRPLWHRMWHEVHDAGGGGLSTMALSVVDIACWDALSKARQEPLVTVLGQFRRSVPAYGSGINLHYTIPELEEQARSWVERGYPAAKMKIGKPETAEDIERLAAVQRIIGPRRPLMVDANQGWDLTTALQKIQAFEPFHLEWMEEPLLADDIPGHARLRRLVSTPIALGENVYTRYQFNQYLALGAVDVIQPDVVRIGGITPFMEIAALADTWNIPVAPHHVPELSGQLLCAIPNGRILEDAEGGSLTDLGVLTTPMPIQNGRFEPPTTPGHGIHFDRDKLRSLRFDDTPPTQIAPVWRPAE